MSNMIECGTCGYPLTPEERTGLMEHNGRVVKPWQSLTDEEIKEQAELLEGEWLSYEGFVRAIEAAMRGVSENG